MALKFGKRQKERVAEVLEAEHETLDEAVSAVLELVDELVAERASFVVVGQLAGTRERTSVPPDDPEAIKVALGPYSTEGDANGAMASLWKNDATGDRFNVWTLPLFHGSPAELHKQQKEKYSAAEAKRKEAQSERFRQQIEQRQLEAQRRADDEREGKNAA